MSFCSYEEAWGSPYDSEHNYDHVSKTKESQDVKNIVVENKQNKENEENVTGIVEVAPLRGALLGGSIPPEHWTTQEPKEEQPHSILSSFESRFDKKIDKLVQTIEKFAQKIQPNESRTTWADVLIFIALGIAAIFLLDMFFSFGKWIVQEQNTRNLNFQNSRGSYEDPVQNWGSIRRTQPSMSRPTVNRFQRMPSTPGPKAHYPYRNSYY